MPGVCVRRSDPHAPSVLNKANTRFLDSVSEVSLGPVWGESLGNLFHCLTTRTVKFYFPISNLNLPFSPLGHFLDFCHCRHGRRDQLPPHHSLLSGRLSVIVSRFVVYFKYKSKY